MNTTEFHSLTHQNESLLLEDPHIAPESLAECIAHLGDEDRYALRKHWDRLVWEAWIPPSQQVERVPSFAELDERRAQRRMRRHSVAVSESAQAPQGIEPDTGPDAA